MNDEVVVLIPFYQRTRGLLTKAVLSALGQVGVDHMTILVVDDGSPISARDELEEILSAQPQRLRIVSQKNKGVAGAKNKGLDSLPRETHIVAFLDSDDEWTPRHLANAVYALRNGYEFYFADFYHPGQTVSAFNRMKRIDISKHPRIPGTDSLHEYVGNMVDQIITGNILGSPVTAYDYSKFPDLRFREDFKHTGEEYLFWLDLALRCRRIAFSSEPECRCGVGVNVYAEAAWGKEKYLRVIVDEVKYRRIIKNEYPISKEAKKFLQGRIKGFRDAFVTGLLHQIRVNRRLARSDTLRAYLAEDRLFPITVWPSVLRVLLKKVQGRWGGRNHIGTSSNS